MKKTIYISGLFLMFLSWSFVAYSQAVSPEKVITPIGFDISKKLSEIIPITPGYADRSWKEKVIPNKDGFLEEFNAVSTWTGPDPVLQDNLTGFTTAH